MNAAARVYIPAEAAAVSQIGIKAVHNAFDKKIVDTVSGDPPLLQRVFGAAR